jgi:chemotaxis family two-component system sensor kinase Cph1
MDGSTELPICDNEPIHIPGSIQPHGVMLVAARRGLTIVQGAGDVEALFGVADWQGAPLAALIGVELAELVADLAKAAPEDDRPHVRFIGQLRHGDTQIDITAHLAALAGGDSTDREHVVLEFEPLTAAFMSAPVLLNHLEEATVAFERAASLDALYTAAARTFRRLTGYDRVLIYRFGDDNAGQVVAEDRGETMPSFLNHYFPASDIPRQARALYLRNLVRVIPDIVYTPAPLRPAAPGAPLDLTDSILRSVSPIHLQYMFNMGVAASASLSLVRDGALWGLVACHAAAPRQIPYQIRVVCRTLAALLSREIRAKEEAEGYRQRLRLRSVEDDVARLLTRDASLDQALSRHIGEVKRAYDADGVAVLRGEELITGGLCPSPDALRELGAWIVASGQTLRATECLGDIYPPAQHFAAAGSGLLALTLSAEDPWLVLWFRAEQVETIRWAGDPRKPPSGEWSGLLTPRASFAEWIETVRGCSRRWTLPEIESAARLRQTLLDLRQNRRLLDLNTQLTNLLQDKMLLLKQKDFLVGEVNHRVQNSLQLVSSFLAIQARESDHEAVVRALEEARRRLAAVGLVHQRLYRGQQADLIDADRYVEELCEDTLAAMGAEWRPYLVLDLTPLTIVTQRAVPLGLILTELMININKYAYGGNPGPIEIRLLQDRLHFQLTVADHGVGIEGATPRNGFGSRMMHALVQQLGGTLTFESNSPGLRATLIASSAAPCD